MMPIVYRGRLLKLDEQRITQLSNTELIDYERELWGWMDKTGGAANIARQLNMIHREVEWRAQDREWHDATHPRQRL